MARTKFLITGATGGYTARQLLGALITKHRKAFA